MSYRKYFKIEYVRINTRLIWPSQQH